MVANDQVDLQQLVISLCMQREPEDQHSFHLYGHGLIRDYFVKYSNYRDLLAEARTQTYLHDLAQANSQAFHVPRVFDAFHDTNRTAYLVMEYVPPPAVTLDVWMRNATSAEERQRRVEIAISKVAAIVSWLHACPLPADAGIGPVGGGVIQHVFFADHSAPMEFASVAALERYVNEVCSLSYDFVWVSDAVANPSRH